MMTSVFWASEETSFGPQNPDKVFYFKVPDASAMIPLVDDEIMSL